MSTSLPLPSSPHWEPRTRVIGMVDVGRLDGRTRLEDVVHSDDGEG
jgi:hypothetical protein